MEGACVSLPSHLAAQLTLRARLLTLSVATTGSTNLSATATGYARESGSFLTDGFAVGLEVTPTGFPQTARGVITAVSAADLTISGGRTVAAVAGSRSLAVSLPEWVAWDNVAVVPVAPNPYAEEEYVPATRTVKTFPAIGGRVEDRGLYVVRWYAKQGFGVAALRKPADAVLALFAPGTTIAVAGANSLKVGLNPGPWAGAIRSDGGGWSVIVVTIPWWWSNINN
jgi:hypothetical protein